MKVSNFNKVILSLVVITLFISLSCASAAVATGDNDQIVGDTFTMSVRFNGSTGYHWVVSPESTGVELISTHYFIDYPNRIGSAGSAYFTFKKTSDHGVAKLNLLGPNFNIVNTMEQEF